MTAIELINQARRDTADANQLLMSPNVETWDDIHPLVLKTRDKLQSALCAIQQLERIAAGVQVPKLGE